MLKFMMISSVILILLLPLSIKCFPWVTIWHATPCIKNIELKKKTKSLTNEVEFSETKKNNFVLELESEAWEWKSCPASQWFKCYHPNGRKSLDLLLRNHKQALDKHSIGFMESNVLISKSQYGSILIILE